MINLRRQSVFKLPRQACEHRIIQTSEIPEIAPSLPVWQNGTGQTQWQGLSWWPQRSVGLSQWHLVKWINCSLANEQCLALSCCTASSSSLVEGVRRVLVQGCLCWTPLDDMGIPCWAEGQLPATFNGVAKAHPCFPGVCDLKVNIFAVIPC